MAKEYLLVDGKLVKADTKLVQVPDTENLNDLADENGAYATQSEEVANEIEELIVKNGVIDGSPKGVYANLSALQTAYPSGASGVYLTSDNGHWYYWNGSAWTDGGVYLSSVADNDFSTNSTNALQNKVLTYKANNLLPSIQGTSLRGLIVQLNSDNGVLLAEDNNHWYYWDGTQYKDGGLYQTIENNPNIKKINEDLNKLITKTTNILDGIKTTNSSFHNENGYIFGNNYSSFLTTYPIPVKPNTTYKFYKNGVLHNQGVRLDAQNADKSFNSLIYSGQYPNSFTTPDNCYFVILTSHISKYADLAIIEDGQELVNEHLDINIIKDDSITDEKLVSKPLQLVNNVVEDIFVNKTKVQSTNIDYTNGNAVSNANFVACDFIEIEPETTYHVMRDDFKISQVGNMAFYNANKKYISGQQSNWSDWTTPANAKYVRFSVYISPFTQATFTFENVKIVKGTSAKAINDIKLFKKEMFSTLNGKKWVVIGDSITEVNYRADLHYHDYIKSKNNMSVVNMGVGGSGYINRQNQNACFYQRAANMPTDADIITVFGGVNDCLFATAPIGEATDTETTTWCGCVNTLIDTIRSLYIYAPLGIISPLPCDWVDPNNESSHDTQLPSDRTCRMSLFVEKLKEICELRGVPFLDLFHSSGMLPNEQNFKLKYFSCGDSRTGDGLHPNSEGQKLFTSKIENFIKGIIVYDN